MADLDLTSFNTHGAAKDPQYKVLKQVGSYLRGNPSAVACFQEVFYDDQLAALDAELLGQRGKPTPYDRKKIEIIAGNGGIYSQRIAPTSKAITGSGLAIYTNLPITPPPRFKRFGRLPVPDVFAAKGVLAVRVSIGGVDLLAATTHFCDVDNDLVDGRGRRSNIGTLAEFFGDETAPIAIVGDFNVDARATSGLDPGLLDELLAVGGRQWIEAGRENAAQFSLAHPVPTLDNGSATLDMVFATAGGAASPALVRGTYRAKDAFTSDHRLVRATLRFS